jgi:hypothetical protein
MRVKYPRDARHSPFQFGRMNLLVKHASCVVLTSCNSHSPSIASVETRTRWGLAASWGTCLVLGSCSRVRCTRTKPRVQASKAAVLTFFPSLFSDICMTVSVTRRSNMSSFQRDALLNSFVSVHAYCQFGSELSLIT